jgi:hypothetical protein
LMNRAAEKSWTERGRIPGQKDQTSGCHPEDHGDGFETLLRSDKPYELRSISPERRIRVHSAPDLTPKDAPGRRPPFAGHPREYLAEESKREFIASTPTIAHAVDRHPRVHRSELYLSWPGELPPPSRNTSASSPKIPPRMTRSPNNNTGAEIERGRVASTINTDATDLVNEC